MNKFLGALGGLLLIAWPTERARAEFTSLHVFGDGVCTTDDSSGPPEYYGNRYCNGRTWVEVLAQCQDAPLDTNVSFFGHISGVFTGGVDRPSDLLDNIAAHSAPVDVGTALYVVWVGNADFVEFLGIDPPPYDASATGPGSDVETWATLVEEAVGNHEAAITALYGKGVRHLVLPLAVDITVPPEFNLSDPEDQAFIRARVEDFNAALQQMVTDHVPTLPGLRVHVADTFGFFDAVIAEPAAYGAVNPLRPPGNDPDLYAAGVNVEPLDLEGPGADYVFWDTVHPTARIQMHLADLMQRILSPPQIMGVTRTTTGVDLVLENVPVGREGTISGSGNLQDWVLETTFTGDATTQVETVNTTAAVRFFRVDYPVVWTFP